MKKETIYLASLSLIATFLTIVILKGATYPYLIEIDSINKNDLIGELYFDFTKDGITDRIKVYNNKLTKGTSIQIWAESSHTILEQINFKYSIRIGDLKFADWNDDGVEDLIAFSYSKEGSFITVYDVKNRKHIHNEYLLFNILDCKGNKPWIPRDRAVIDFYTDNDLRRKAVVLIDGAFNFNCRSILIIDTKTLAIDSQFNSTAAFTDLMVDKDKNGKFKEIIVTSSAPANDGGDYEFSDNYCWFFSFDEKLNLKNKPIKLGEFPSILRIERSFFDEIFLVHHKNYKDDLGYDIYKYYDNKIEKVFSSAIRAGGKVIRIIGENDEVKYRVFGLNTAVEFDSSFQILDKITFNKEGKKSNLFYSHDGLLYIFDSEIYLLNNELEIIGKKEEKNFAGTYGLSVEYSKYYNNDTRQSSYLIYDNQNIYKITPEKNFLNNHIYILSIPIYVIVLVLMRFSLYAGLRFLLDIKTKRNLIYSNINGMLLIDHKLRIKYINEVLIELLGLVKDNYKNQEFEQIFNTSEVLLNHIKNGIKKSEYRNENLSLFFNKKEFNGRIIINPFKILNNVVIGYFIELINYTEPISLERIKAWSKTSQKLAHDIKTPLSTIQLNLSAIKQRIENEVIENREPYYDDIEDIKIELNRISNLTRNFLQLTNLNRPNKEIISVEELLNRPLNRFESYFKKTIMLELVIENKETKIICDVNQFEQVFEVLIENSIESIGSSGIIRIETKDKIKYVEFRIIDNGEGIKEDNLEKIFEPYFTTKNEGSGLGLIIAKNIIEDHNGKIIIESTYEKGTTVKFTIPKWIINEDKN